MASARVLLAEFIGTFTLVFIGSLAVDTSNSLVAVALAHGLVLMAMVYTIGPISGAHINPAITIGLLSAQKIKPLDAAQYVVSQLLGGVVAGFLHAAITPWSRTSYGLTVPTELIGGSAEIALLVEAVATFFLAFVVYLAAVAEKTPQPATGLAIGMTLAFAILAAGPLTGASLNPARTLGPAVASMNFTAHWAYWVGPIVGAIVGTSAARVVAEE